MKKNLVLPRNINDVQYIDIESSIEKDDIDQIKIYFKGNKIGFCFESLYVLGSIAIFECDIDEYFKDMS